MKKLLFLFLYLITYSHLDAQQFKHYDFLGAGHDNGITVTTSSSNIDSKKTVDGFPIQNDQQLKEASRFLAQATFGADLATIQMTAAMGYEAWLDEQFNLPQIKIVPKMFQQNDLYANAEEEEEVGGIFKPWYESAWMHNTFLKMSLKWAALITIC